MLLKLHETQQIKAVEIADDRVQHIIWHAERRGHGDETRSEVTIDTLRAEVEPRSVERDIADRDGRSKHLCRSVSSSGQTRLQIDDLAFGVESLLRMLAQSSNVSACFRRNVAHRMVCKALNTFTTS